MTPINVYLESGSKRVFAGAIDWPGWCRIAKDEEAALQALVDYGPRYDRVLRRSRLGFKPPQTISDLAVVERIPGNATTDFGAPDAAPAADAGPIDEADLKRYQTLLRACWRALDEAVKAAEGKELRKGPRGGGREVEGILRHVLGADASYIRRLAWKFSGDDDADLSTELARTRQAIQDALANAAHNGVPAQGPRGGSYWKPRYFVRRVAWHTLDHAWEIEDRIL